MARYLISFDRGWMDISDEELPDVARDARAVLRESADAGVFVFGAGLAVDERATVVAADGTVTDGPYPETKELIGGLMVVDVPTRDEAARWAIKIAAACRCAQEVRQLLPDPTVDELLAR